MAFFDLAPADLEQYRPDVREPDDFAAFWSATLSAADAAGFAPTFDPVPTGLSLVRSYDVTFSGYAGQPIRAWLTVPAVGDGPFPAVVGYVGYNGGRGLAHQHLLWPSAGYVHLVMDTRGQGSGWARGDTPDPEGSAPQLAGFMTRGIGDPETYFYRRVYTDAVRAVAAVRSHPLVDATRVAVTGGSQGGGLALAVAGLVPDLAAALPDVPFLCHFERAIGFTDTDPYAEIARYLAVHRGAEERVRRTLSYFDGVNFAKRANAPALFSTALMDDVCPPSTVFAAYHAYPAADKEIRVYPFNGHEGGSFDHTEAQLAWLPKRLTAGR